MDVDTATASDLRITTSRDELATTLGVVARGLSSRGAVQVLTGILLEVVDERLVLAATDMELSLRASLTGDVAGDGAVVVPGRLLADLVRLLPDDRVTLAYEQ